MASDGRYGPVGGKGSDAVSELKEMVTAISVQMRTNGREIGEIKQQMQGISRVLTTVEATLPNLVTKADCANSRSDMSKDTAHAVQDLKDRMEGRREVTGVHQTLPEMLAEQIIAERAKRRPKDSVLPSSKSKSKKEPKGAFYWVKIVSAVITIAMTVFGAVTFINHTIERQERSEARQERMQEVIENISKRLPPPEKTASNP